MAAQKGLARLEAEKALKEKRGKQLVDILPIVKRLEECKERALAMKAQFTLLSSVSKGLYEEIDKLSKKAPAEVVTDLVLEQVNDVIREVKELAKDDIYVQRLKEFVAAGDNPQHRDVVVVLRQLRQGLDRFEETVSPRRENFSNKLYEAKTIQFALQLFQEGNYEVSPYEIREFGFSPSDKWFLGYGESKHFDWNRLDRSDFETYFPTC